MGLGCGKSLQISNIIWVQIALNIFFAIELFKMCL